MINEFWSTTTDNFSSNQYSFKRFSIPSIFDIGHIKIPCHLTMKFNSAVSFLNYQNNNRNWPNVTNFGSWTRLSWKPLRWCRLYRELISHQQNLQIMMIIIRILELNNSLAMIVKPMKWLAFLTDECHMRILKTFLKFSVFRSIGS